MKHNEIIENIKNKIMNDPLLNQYFKELHQMEYETDTDSFAIRCQQTENESTRTKMLLMQFNDHDQIGITNIFLPTIMRNKGLGMKMIELIYSSSTEHDYKLFIVDMVPSFYEKMLKKGAIPIEEYETVEIVKATRLFSIGG